MIFRLFLLLSALSLALTFEAPAAPVALLPPQWVGALQPQVAVAPTGRVHVVFGKENAIYHTTSSDGRTFSEPVKVGELEKLALKMRRGPRIAVTGQGIVVSAISFADGMLHYWKSSDEGSSWAKQQPLNTVATSAREGLHAMAGGKGGLVATAWLDLRSGGMELWCRVSRDGGSSWDAETRVYASPDGHICECCHPSLAIGPNGEIAAMWRNWLGGSRDMWLAISRDGGKSFAETRKLGTGTWPLAGCPMDGGGVAFAPDGSPVAVWRRDQTLITGATEDRETPLSSSAMQGVVQVGRGRVFIAWEESGRLVLRKDQAAPVEISADGRMAAMAATPTGSVVLVWETSAGALMIDKFE